MIIRSETRLKYEYMWWYLAAEGQLMPKPKLSIGNTLSLLSKYLTIFVNRDSANNKLESEVRHAVLLLFACFLCQCQSSE
jgi:hypothetical protein